MVGTYEVKISKLARQGRLLTLRLDFAPGTAFDFSSGQYVIVSYADGAGVFKRSYSISSSPEEKGYIELGIALKEGGRGSAALEKVRKGDKLSIMGPLGKFGLAPGLSSSIFIAGGTGISPLRSMMKDLFNRGVKSQVVLFYSFRTEEEYLYRKEFETLARKNKNFILVPICTRADSNWKGETAYVQDIFKKYVQDCKDRQVYACGPVPMVDAVFSAMIAMGFKEDQLHREIWGV